MKHTLPSTEKHHKQVPSTVICIIRHGETDWNSTGRLQGREDIELNNKGREQAEQVAAFLTTESWDLIVASPLKRAYETACIIATRLDLTDIRGMDSLIERDYGQASGLLPDERHNRFPEGAIPGQEEFEHLRNRAMTAMESIAKEFEGKRIIVISHGAFINSVLYTVSGAEFGSFKTRLKNGCITKLIFSKNQWSVLFYNKTVDELITGS